MLRLFITNYINKDGGSSSPENRMRLVFYYSNLEAPLDVPANKGFDLNEILTLLKSLRSKGIEYETVESSALPEVELSEAYVNAAVPSVYKKYRIRKIFGSRRRSGWLFGKGVPGLLVYEEGDKYPSDVFPHEELNGNIVTVKDYLENLLPSTPRHEENR